jgi:hypothetical protein
MARTVCHVVDAALPARIWLRTIFLFDVEQHAFNDTLSNRQCRPLSGP